MKHPIHLWSYPETEIYPLWVEDNNDFPEALWLSNLPDSEYVLFEVL
jgi:hypothetical protein